MAASYLEETLARIPDGRFRLGGWSMGGIVAVEMARQLVAQGKDVEPVILIDSPCPTGDGESDRDMSNDAMWRRQFAQDLERRQGPVTQGTNSTRAVNSTELQSDQWFEVFKANTQALAQFRPEACTVPVVLIRATEGLKGGHVDPELGWAAVTNSVELLWTEGDHYSIFDAPRLPSLVASMVKAMTPSVDSSDRDAGRSTTAKQGA
jgi:thioesterase domain-containing protein